METKRVFNLKSSSVAQLALCGSFEYLCYGSTTISHKFVILSLRIWRLFTLDSDGSRQSKVSQSEDGSRALTLKCIGLLEQHIRCGVSGWRGEAGRPSGPADPWTLTQFSMPKNNFVPVPVVSSDVFICLIVLTTCSLVLCLLNERCHIGCLSIILGDNYCCCYMIFSNLSMSFCLKGSETAEEYSNDDLTREK